LAHFLQKNAPTFFLKSNVMATLQSIFKNAAPIFAFADKVLGFPLSVFAWVCGFRRPLPNAPKSKNKEGGFFVFLKCFFVCWLRVVGCVPAFGLAVLVAGSCWRSGCRACGGAVLAFGPAALGAAGRASRAPPCLVWFACLCRRGLWGWGFLLFIF
jgi:hypothetical protein